MFRFEDSIHRQPPNSNSGKFLELNKIIRANENIIESLRKREEEATDEKTIANLTRTIDEIKSEVEKHRASIRSLLPSGS